MNNPEIIIGIICTLLGEYNACKEILGLQNESELSGRIVSERRKFEKFLRQVKKDIKEIEKKIK